MLWCEQHKAAYERAKLDAAFVFNRCPICGRSVCNGCFHVSETGEFVSDGSVLTYTTLNTQDIVPTWKSHGKSAFDAAVDVFVYIAQDPSESKIRSWVWANVPPSRAFEDIILEEWAEEPDALEDWMDMVVDEGLYARFQATWQDFDESQAEESWDEEDAQDTTPAYPTEELTALDFTGKTFVLTGDFQNHDGDRDIIKQAIEAKGGKCTGAISGKTSYLVLGDFEEIGAKKLEQAQAQQEKGSGLKIITESTLFKFL